MAGGEVAQAGIGHAVAVVGGKAGHGLGKKHGLDPNSRPEPGQADKPQDRAAAGQPGQGGKPLAARQAKDEQQGGVSSGQGPHLLLAQTGQGHEQAACREKPPVAAYTGGLEHGRGGQQAAHGQGVGPADKGVAHLGLGKGGERRQKADNEPAKRAKGLAVQPSAQEKKRGQDGRPAGQGGQFAGQERRGGKGRQGRRREVE